MPLKNPAYLWSIGVNAIKGTASSGAATVNAEAFIVTTESITTAAGAEYTLTLTNSSIVADSLPMVSVGYGSSSAGTPWIWGVTVTAGQLVITVTNLHASAAFNGTLKIYGLVLNAKWV